MNVLPGKPRDRERKAVYERFQGMNEGDLLTHAECERLIGVSRQGLTANEYYTVMTSALRHVERKSGVRLVPVRTEGYRYPTGLAQLAFGASIVRGGVRRIRRGVRTVAYVEKKRLSGPEQQVQEHWLLNTKRMDELMRAEVKAGELQIGSVDVKPQRRIE